MISVIDSITSMGLLFYEVRQGFFYFFTVVVALSFLLFGACVSRTWSILSWCSVARCLGDRASAFV